MTPTKGSQEEHYLAMFYAIVASSDDAIMSKTLQGIITSWNPAAERIFGYSEQEAVGQPMLMLLPPDRLDEEVEILNKLARGERIEHFETIRQRKDGTLINISVTISPISDSNGKVCGASKIARDITKQKKNEAEAAKLAAIVASSDDAIMSKTLQGIITSWNPAAERIFGYSEQEAVGQPMTMLLPSDRLDEEVEILKKLARGERIDHFETIRQRKNGALINISVTISPVFDSHGKVLGASKIARDITEGKHIEKELCQYREHLEELVALATLEVNAIVQTAVNGVISIDEKGIVHLFNPAAEKLFGWVSEEVVGKNVSMLMPEPFSSSHNSFLERYVQTGEKNIIGIGREITGLCKDGSTFPAHLAVGHAELSLGTHLFVAFIADITQQKESERELVEAKNHAEMAVKAKANFLANMSHEIRTPMNAIIGFAELLMQNKELPPVTHGYIQTILNSGKHLLTVINDILDLSKIEAGKISIESVCFHLPNAVQDALQTIEFHAEQKGIDIQLKIDEHLPKRLRGDPTRLRQVILNLVGNAIKFTEKGHIKIAVQADKKQDMVHFTVADTGIGMSQKQAEKIFESFTQADPSTTRRYGGTGLGTTISKQIVELMGGRIWVDSVEGKGSSFHFTAHLTASENSESCLYEGGGNLSESYASPRCFKILLVEDIEVNATLAMLRLNQQGHEVTWVKNGLEAVAAFQQVYYDIIWVRLFYDDI